MLRSAVRCLGKHQSGCKYRGQCRGKLSLPLSVSETTSCTLDTKYITWFFPIRKHLNIWIAQVWMSVLLWNSPCVSYILCRSVCGCKLSIPGHAGCNLTGGLTLVNPLLGVLRMMMWAVDPPRWFHFLRASSGSQIEKLWGYYKVRGRLTLNMMTIPSWHFHFLKRLIPCGSWGQRCLLIFVQISSSFLTEGNVYRKKMWRGFALHITENADLRKTYTESDISCRVEQNCLCEHKCAFLHIFSYPSFRPSNFFKVAAMQATSGRSWCI